MDYLRGLIGLIVIVGIAYLLSGYKKKIDWRLVAVGITLQIIIALLVGKVPINRSGFEAVGTGFVKFLS
ncbi:MAG TPA: Na+ dependent nucleoside transporter N-terminal domain-containing protein, partial [Chryseolinea sp.]|nr:Na+ dependent nucleoside transporter N-terminal domain-containing protein [Chryseolinea sp.]